MKSPKSISLPQLFAAVTTLAVAWLVTPLPVFAQNYQTIDPPSSTYTYPTSINDKGQIVGYYVDSNRVEHGFVENNGIYTTIDLPIALKLSLGASIRRDKLSGSTRLLPDPKSTWT